MTESQQRAADEMQDLEMVPSQAAALFDMVLAFTSTNPAQSFSDRSLMRALSVQGDFFRAAGVLYTSGMAPASLAAMDAKGSIAVRLALPSSVLMACAAEGYLHLVQKTEAHRAVREQISLMDAI